VRVWDAASGDCLRVLDGHEDSVESVAISPDGKRIVSGSFDNSVRVWDAASGTPMELTAADEELLSKQRARSHSKTIHHLLPSGKELDIATIPGGFVVLERPSSDAPWKIARARGDYWRYVNYATDGPAGRMLWSADVLGPVPEV